LVKRTQELESESPEVNTNRRVLAALAEVAGERFQEDDITYDGTRLMIPRTMTAKDAIKTLQSHIEQQEAETRFSRTYRFRPWDGAAAFSRSIKRLTGTTGIGRPTWEWFTKIPPQMMTIPVGVSETMQVPWGEIAVSLFQGSCYLTEVHDREYGPLFQLIVDCPRKYRASVEGLFMLVEEELKSASIYRGKAFDGQSMPEFIDLAGVDREKVVYSDEVEAQLSAQLWSLLRHTESMRKHDVPLKRSVLLHGPYGTGKTLAAFLTAQESVRNGWTFVYCRPGKDDLEAVMGTARLYQPAVVFFEDVDSIGEGDSTDRDSVVRLLDLFDGIQAKGTELVAVLTTNHPERIHKAMIRPGRLDAVIRIGDLDAGGIERMIRSVVDSDNLIEPIDVDPIAEAMQGYLPAFVKEAIDRAVRYSIARNDGEIDRLATEDFVHAAKGLRDQLEMMEGAAEGRAPDVLSTVVASLVRDQLDRTVATNKGGTRLEFSEAER
jgi:transitional endoplasmic reticulum ATPase